MNYPNNPKINSNTLEMMKKLYSSQRCIKRLVLTLCMLSVFASPSWADPQTGGIDASFDGADFIQVAMYLEKNYGYNFTYKTENLSYVKPVSLSVRNATIDRVMEICLINYYYIFGFK